MKVLFLDDDQTRHEAFAGLIMRIPTVDDIETHQVTTAHDAIEHMHMHEYDVICLDHDLGEQQMVSSLLANTGYRVACWIEENLEDPPPVIIHSMNTVGLMNMMRALRNSRVYAAPFGTNMFNQTLIAILKELDND